MTFYLSRLFIPLKLIKAEETWGTFARVEDNIVKHPVVRRTGKTNYKPFSSSKPYLEIVPQTVSPIFTLKFVNGKYTRFISD